MRLVLFSMLAALCYASGLESEPVPGHAKRQVVQGRPRWDVLHVFDSRTVAVDCSREFRVYVARTELELEAVYTSRAWSWCSVALSWDALFQTGTRRCDVTVSPYGSTLMAVVPKDDSMRLPSLKSFQCTFKERSELSLQLVGTGLAGLTLFTMAPTFAHSIAFRISVGGLVSVLLCSLIVLIFVMRRVKHGKTAMTVAAGLGAIGVSVSGLLRFWFRFPDVPELLSSYWFLLYVAVSFLIGMAVSYYFDTSNGKIIDIISAGLRLLGCLMVFYSLSQLWELATAAVVALVASLLITKHRPAQPGAEYAAGGGADGLDAPVSASPRGLSPSPPRSAVRLPSASRLLSPRALWPKKEQARPETHPEAHHEAHDHTPQAAMKPVPLRESSPKGQSEHRRRLLEHAPSHSHGGPPAQSAPASEASGWAGYRPAASAPAMSPISPGHESPLLAAGHVRNAATGRLINVGGATYNALLKKGFELDREQGTLFPPARSPDAAPASASRGKSPTRRSSRRSAHRPPQQAPASSTMTSPF